MTFKITGSTILTQRLSNNCGLVEAKNTYQE